MYVFLTTPERLKDLLTERGLDIAEVAKATGLSSSALSNYENDKNNESAIASYSRWRNTMA